MATTFKLLKNGKQQTKKCTKKQKQNKKPKAKQNQKEMKTHLTKSKVVHKSRFKASPVYIFISILTHVKEYKKTTKTKQTNKEKK
jgi:hypothetical protein